MMEIRSVTLPEILAAREVRVQRQSALLAQFGRPLVCFTMNIAGPVKCTPQIVRGFRLGCRLLDLQLMRVRAAVLHREACEAATGCEAFYVVDLDPESLKALTMELEDGSDLGRLFDMDVLTPGGCKLERAAERGCLVCGKPGKGCARSRAHSVAALTAAANGRLETALRRWDRETAAELAVRALLWEACTTPKPGLVDRNNSGSHRDMDQFTFQASAAALWPYFQRCTELGQETAGLPPAETFAALRWPGKEAEMAMLAATGGVNTHKGAIFTMGVVCGALGRLDRMQWRQPEQVLAQCAAMTKGIVARDFAGLTAETAQTAGQKLYLAHGISGVRGQLEAGLPTVLAQGLPVLEAGLAQGKSLEEAGAAALLALIASTEDTNLIARGGLEAQRAAAAEAAELLSRTPYPDREALEQLDRAYVEKNLSPGGCADLLAVCYLLHFLKEEGAA